MPWGTLKDQWERRTALKIAVRQTLSQQMSVGRSRTVDWFANMFANLSTAHDHWFSTARPLRLRPTPWGTRKVILRSPRFSAVNCPQTARTVDECQMWPGLTIIGAICLDLAWQTFFPLFVTKSSCLLSKLGKPLTITEFNIYVLCFNSVKC